VAGTGTDNRTAINAACAAYPIVHLPKGIYKVTTPGIILVADQVFTGDGPDQTVIFASRASATDSFNLITSYNYTTNPYTNSNQRITLSGFSLYGKCDTITALGLGPGFVTYGHNFAGNGIALYKANGSLIQNIYLEKTSLYGIAVFDTDEATIRKNSVKNVGLLSYAAGDVGQPWETVIAAANGITVSGSATVSGKQVLIEGNLVDTFRDVGINSWKTTDVSIVHNTVIGTLYAGVTSLNGGGIGFSLEGGGVTGARSTFRNNRHLNCNSTGFYLGSGALVADCLVVGAASGTFDGGFKISGDDVSLTNPKVFSQGVIYPDFGVQVSMDATGVFADRVKISGGIFNSCVVGLDIRGAKDSEVIDNTIYCNSVALSSGIKWNAFGVADDGYVSNSTIKGNKIYLAADSGIYTLITSRLTVEDNTVLGAAVAGIRNSGCDNSIFQRNTAKQYDGTHLVPLGILFEGNPSACQVMDNYLADYDNSSTNYPYGLSLATTGTAAVVRHSNTDVAQETINGILTAKAGSYIWTKNGAGNGVEIAINTNGATTWTSGAPY
jgi:hypothetical protein